MDTQAYIQSDILDRYVLGDVSEQERKEVECMSHIYPEIKTNLDALQESVNSYASFYEKAPPTELKGKIMGEIMKLSKVKVKPNAKIISLGENKETSKPSATTYKWFAAASVVLFIASAFLYFDTRNKLSASQNETITLANKLGQIDESSKNQLAELKTKNELMAAGVAMFNNPENKIIKMAGIEKTAPTAHATICWNSKTKEVYVGFANLPAPPADKQYQLWAIADGKPVDLGVIDKNTDALSVQKMKVIEKAQAFAVTLEKAGGNPTPTLAAMYVMGGV
ncbi:MAG TPA: anti-sigma factor [Bacteroidia bacterium]|nr:anti-sigma factor [Bacteroidia bacterium]